MESQFSNEPPDIAFLVRNIPNSEITSTLELLQVKTSQDLLYTILNIKNSINSINDAKNQMSDYDLMYLYHSIRHLSQLTQNLEKDVLVKLKNREKEYVCNRCMKRIKIYSRMSLLGNLKSHICSSVGLSKTKKIPFCELEYDLCQSIQYDNNIKEQLFFNEVINTGERVYFYTIYNLDEVILCLVCECNISGVNNIMQHIVGQRHVKALSEQYDILQIYHSNFAKLEPKYQLLQREFGLENDVKTKCMKCKKCILFTDLLKHLRDSKCFKSKSGKTKKIPFCELEYDLCQSIQYDNNIKEQLFFNEVINTGERVYFYTMYNLDEVISCLVCECNISGVNNTMQHIVGERHVKALSEQYDILQIYHSNFAKLEPKYQLLQREFGLENDMKTKCMKCKKCILFTDLLKHLRDSKCFKSKSDATEYNRVHYNGLIKKTIYKDLLDWCVIIDNTQYPILQNIEGRIYCLVCNTFVARAISTHIDTRQHIESVSTKNILETLIKYHKVWSVQPAYVQLEQVYFRRRDRKITCTVCSTYMPYDAQSLKSHVESANHKMFMMRYKGNGHQSESGTSRSASVEPHAQVNKYSSESVSSRSTSAEAERHTTSTSSTSFNTENKTAIHTTTNSNKISTIEQDSLVQNNILGKVKMVPYEKSIFDELYPDSLIHFTISVGCIKYPTVIKRGMYKHCFICNEDVHTSALLHVNSTQHEESLSSEHRRSLIKKFHDLWLDMPSVDQCRQVLFNVDDKIKCSLCNIGVEYDTKELKSHLDSWQHVHKVLSTYYNNISIDKPDSSNLKENIGDVNTLIDLSTTGEDILDNETKHADGIIKDKEVINTLCEINEQDTVSMQNNIQEEDIVAVDGPLINLSETNEVDRCLHSLLLLNPLYTGNQIKISEEMIINNKMLSLLAKFYKEDTSAARGLLKKDFFAYLEERAKTENDHSDVHTTSETNEKKEQHSATKLGSIAYSKEIVNDLYGEDLIHYNVRINSVKYPFIQNMGSYKRCLICNIDLMGSVLFHVNSTPHIEYSNISEKLDQLKRYHDLWLSFSDSEQAEQKYFEIGEKLCCAPCQKELDYDVDILNSHIFSIGHGNKVWSLNNPSNNIIDLTENCEATKEEVELAEVDLLELSDNQNESDPRFLVDDSFSTSQLLLQDDTENELVNINSRTNDSNNAQQKIVKIDKDLPIDLNQDTTIQDVSKTSPKRKRKPRYTKKKSNTGKTVTISMNSLSNKSDNAKQTELNSWTDEYPFVDESNSLKYYLYSIMSPNDIPNQSDISESKTIANIHTTHAREVSATKNILDTSYDENLCWGWMDNIYCSQETNCVKYYIYSIMPTKEIIKGSTNDCSKKLKGKPKYTKKKSNTGKTGNISINSLSNKTENVKQTQLNSWTGEYPFVDESNSLKYYLYSIMSPDDIPNQSDISESITIANIHTTHAREVSATTENILDTSYDENLCWSWMDDIYCSQETNCVKYYIYSIMPTREISKGSTNDCPKKLKDESVVNKMYDEAILNTIYSGLLEYTIRYNNKQYMCLQNRNKGMYCLLCRKYVDNTAHINDRDHINYKNHLERLQIIQVYHNIFLSLPPHYQWQQIFFFINHGNMTCSVCQDTVSYVIGEVIEHMESKRHKQPVDKFNSFTSETDTRDDSEDNYEEDNSVLDEMYDKAILNTIYSGLQEYTIQYNNRQYMCLQNRNIGMYCLLCRKYVDNAGHIHDRDHINFKNHLERLQIIHVYHNIFSSLPPHYQWQQIFFFNNHGNMTCSVCEDTVSYIIGEVIEHMVTKTHREQVDAFNNHTSETGTKDDGEDVISDDFNHIEEDWIPYHCPLILIGNNEYFCVYCHSICKKENHETAAHNKNLKKPKNYTIEYLLQLGKLGMPYEDVPNDFIPSSVHLTFCLKCGIHVKYQKLLDHLDRFHYDDVEHSLKDKLSNDFSSIKGSNYSKKILQTVFQHSPPECDVSENGSTYPVLQVSGENIYCLLCETKVFQKDPLDHLASDYHIRLHCVKSQRRKVKKYHSGWSPIYWDQLQFFDNEDNLFHCILCNDKFGKKKLKCHIEDEKHILRALNSVYELSSEYLTNDNGYSESLKSAISNNELLHIQKMNETVRQMNSIKMDIVQVSPNNKFMCLMCQVEVDDIIRHSTTDIHHQTKLLDWRTNMEPIRFFHQSWSCMDSEFEGLRNLFYPVTPTVIFCTVCCLNLNYAYLVSHLKQCHTGNEVAFREKLSPVFIFHSKKEYCEKVLRILYKDNIRQCDIILESVAYPLIQTLNNAVRCLLCYTEILNNKYHHLSSREHIANALSATARKKLKSYHDTWLDGDEEFQMQQMYFERDGPSFYCKVCLLNANAFDLREHIRNDLHKSSLNKFLINERFSGKTNVFQAIEIIPQLSNDNCKLHSDECHNLDSGSDEDNETCPKQYDEIVLEELYPHFNSHYLTLDNIRYPLFRRTIVGLKCMICKRNPEVTCIDQHLMLDSHKSKLVCTAAQNKLKRFHDSWSKEDVSVQTHQKYFHRMKCILCDVQVEYEMIRIHVLTIEHMKSASLSLLKNQYEESSDSSPKSVRVPSAVVIDPNTYVPFKNINSNSGVSPIKNAIKNKAKAASPPKAGTSKKAEHHQIKKSVPNPTSPVILDKIPLRYTAHKQFLIFDKSNNIFCKCCSKKLMHDTSRIKEHLDSANHLSVSRLNKNKVKYFCEICDKRYSMESSWDNHLVDLTHVARCDNLDKKRKTTMTEYECSTCKFVIYGDNMSLKRHISGLMRKKGKEITLPKSVVYLLSSRNFIASNAEKLLLEANKASQSQDKERQVCLALVKVLKEAYPMCKAYPFGSRVTGLGYCDSDLDVFLDIGNMYYGNQKQEASDQASIVNKVAKVLQKHKTSFGDINKVAAARTPIVQVFHKDSSIDCDISFRHGLSVENTAFISLCLDLQPILRPAMLYLKEWYASSNLTGFSSYALTMLMVFYLQTNQHLLSIEELRRLNPEASNVIDGWETIKYSASLQGMKERVKKCDYTVIQLLEHFFEYYAKFDFEKFVICPLMGDIIAKSAFNGNGANLPPEMSRYVIKLHCQNPEYFRNLTPMCVQDPFDLSHNLTKACSKDMVKKFQAYCDLSKKHISALD